MAHNAEKIIDHLKECHRDQLELSSIYQYVNDFTAAYELEFQKAHSRSFRKGARKIAVQPTSRQDVKTEVLFLFAYLT